MCLCFSYLLTKYIVMFLSKSKYVLSKPTFLSIFFMIFSVQVFIGQTYSEEETDNNATQRIDDAESFFSIFGANNQVNSRNSTIEGNSVFLTQIGSFNQVNINTQTQASEINITQNGASNYADLDYNVNTAFTNLVQNGNNNTIIDYVLNPQEDISLELTQEGDNITFERFGVNSITKSLKFIQTEASPTIIVRSFQ